MPLEISSWSGKLPAIANGRISRVSKRAHRDAHICRREVVEHNMLRLIVPEASRAITLT